MVGVVTDVLVAVALATAQAFYLFSPLLVARGSRPSSCGVMGSVS
jgi:hypothetical protein